MLDTPRWKKIVIVLVMTLATIYSMPNLFPADPAVQIAGKVDADADEALKERVQGVLEKAKIDVKQIDVAGGRVLARLKDTEAQEQARVAIAAALNPDVNQPAYTVSLNMASTVPAWLRAIGAKPMNLGLDLQGGVHFLMEVSEADIKAQNEARLVDEISALLRSEKLRGTVSRGAEGPVVVLRSAADRDRFAGLLLNRYPTVRFATGVATSASDYVDVL